MFSYGHLPCVVIPLLPTLVGSSIAEWWMRNRVPVPLKRVERGSDNGRRDLGGTGREGSPGGMRGRRMTRFTSLVLSGICLIYILIQWVGRMRS